MTPHKTLVPVTSRMIKILRREGINPTDDEIYWLGCLGEMTKDPPPRPGNPEGFRVVKRGHTFNPPSIGSRIWLHKYALPVLASLDDEDGFWEDVAILFSLEADVETLKDLTDPEDVVREVIKWGRKCRLLAQDITPIIEEFFPQDPMSVPTEEDLEANPNYGKLIAGIVDQSGGTPEEWIWRTPYASAINQVDEICARMSMEAGRKVSDRSSLALKNLLLAVEQIKRNHAEAEVTA